MRKSTMPARILHFLTEEETTMPGVKRSGTATTPARAGSQSPQTGKAQSKSGPKKKS